MSRVEGPRDRAVADFARSLATQLAEGRVAGQYTRLVLVAPPKFLGLLRGSLDGVTDKCVVGSIAKDLASTDDAGLREHIGEVIAV